MPSPIVDSVESLTYSLARHVPDMWCGFTIRTYFGEVSIQPEDARPFAEALECLLKEKIQQIQKGKMS